MVKPPGEWETLSETKMEGEQVNIVDLREKTEMMILPDMRGTLFRTTLFSGDSSVASVSLATIPPAGSVTA